MILIPKYGEKSVFVKEVQKALNHFGADPKLVVDGDYGPKTKQAISVFQKNLDLRGTGHLGPKTINLLGLEEAMTLEITDEVYPNKSILLTAQKEIGVKEIPGKGSNKRVEEYLAYGGSKNNDVELSDSVPWCAGFVGWVIEKALGIESSNNLMARSYERMGYRRVDDLPQPGDVVTMYRNGKKSGSGHVGFYVGQTKGGLLVLGGNQSDAVNVREFSREESGGRGITGIWRVVDDPISRAQAAELQVLSEAIINNVTIDVGNKVT